ncbi:MAG TPA: alpha/beta hydrolase, partial [Steroidobacteraceae bacterium]|nr:alpha/beta hydrolase [Steroidobacteraceae bacterium]
FDPITPPRYAEQILTTATDALHVTQPAHGHGQLGSQCIGRLIATFLETGKPLSLDIECALEAAPAPFFVDFTGTPP